MAGPWWCWLCQRERSECGGTNGSCPAVERDAATYRDDLENGSMPMLPILGGRRLANERETGMSQREMARETVETAKAQGREIVSAKSYGDAPAVQRKTPDLRGL